MKNLIIIYIGVIICLYADDMLIFGSNLQYIEETKTFISFNFNSNMKDMREADGICWIKIVRTINGLSLTQSHYIEKAIKKYTMRTESQFQNHMILA
jgi:hypothetical protein